MKRTIAVLIAVSIPSASAMNKNPCQEAVVGTWSSSHNLTYKFYEDGGSGVAYAKGESLEPKGQWGVTSAPGDKDCVLVLVAYGSASIMPITVGEDILTHHISEKAKEILTRIP